MLENFARPAAIQVGQRRAFGMDKSLDSTLTPNPYRGIRKNNEEKEIRVLIKKVSINIASKIRIIYKRFQNFRSGCMSTSGVKFK